LKPNRFLDKPKAMQKTSEKAKEANKSREAQAATVAARKATRKTAKMEMMPLAGISCVPQWLQKSCLQR